MKLKLPDFSRADVLIVGDLMLDRYWYGQTARISPEAPVPVVRVRNVEERAGAAGNVALNVAALGGKATVAGLTGDDAAAAKLREILGQRGVDCRFNHVRGCDTVTKLRVISRQQQLIRLDFEDGFMDCDAKALQTQCCELLGDAHVLILSDYGKGTLQAVSGFIEAVRAAGKPVLVDPKGSDFGRYRGASVITPNLSEFESVVGACGDESALAERAEALRADLDLQAVLITRSEKGMSLFESGQPPLHLPTRAREVFDVTGAGDTVVAALGVGLAAGLDLPSATALANLAAGVVVRKLGTATATVQELQAAMLTHEPMRAGVVGAEELVEFVRNAQTGGGRVVMTNGCFDILHAGHVSYLAQAAALGDRLIVAVNDDDSARRLKGQGRPVNSLSRRMAVLSALESVDWVVPFSEDTPESLICAVRPDTLVKGGDYRPQDIAGGDCVRASGGEVRTLDFV
ncbi:MAG: bifunctional D-glycero-beta-D-manno-heptose-7-phosphate kinase/D-glycero-beta-D-manno-heptose 1-phosphate adenylyltransferase HldE, partial [Gammaproteobacteria bacterium]